MSVDIVLGLVRHFLTLAGGFLIAKGYADDAGVTQAVGAICTLIGFAWSVVNKTSTPAALPKK